MLLKEINDPEDRGSIFNTLNRFSKDYGPGGRLASNKRPSDEEIAARKAQDAEKHARMEKVEQALEPLAQKYHGSEFNEFAKEAQSKVSPEELKLVNLELMFDKFNPEKAEERRAADVTSAEFMSKTNNLGYMD